MRVVVAFKDGTTWEDDIPVSSGARALTIGIDAALATRPDGEEHNGAWAYPGTQP